MIGPDLLAALAAAPALPDAACAGRWELFDPAENTEDEDDAEYRLAAAQRICAQCPALQECSEWLDTLPPTKRPYGVVAGRIYHLPRPGRPRRTA